MYLDISELMRLAHAVGRAKQSGEISSILEAERALCEYESLIYESEGMIIPNVDLNDHKDVL